MASNFPIHALSVVKNEDLHIKHAVSNVLEFADTVTVVDNGSTDGTLDILRGFGTAITLCRQPHLPLVHREHIEQWAGKNVWLFGFDGDEIYDPAGLLEIRQRLRAGEFDDFWQVRGRFFHITEIAGSRAKGYHAPPSRNPTKFFNFSKLESWLGDGFRAWFLSKGRIYRPGVRGSQSHLFAEMPWDETPLRCIHKRHCQRSSQEPVKTRGCRLGMEDAMGRGSRKDRGGKDDKSIRLTYRVGDISEIDITPFFRE